MKGQTHTVEDESVADCFVQVYQRSCQCDQCVGGVRYHDGTTVVKRVGRNHSVSECTRKSRDSRQ